MENGEAKPTSAGYRKDILDEAAKCVLKDRNAAYGNPEDNFRVIADFWSTYLSAARGVPIAITTLDVANMMIQTKLARLANNSTHKDSWVDVAGYAACGGGVAGFITAPNS